MRARARLVSLGRPPPSPGVPSPAVPPPPLPPPPPSPPPPFRPQRPRFAAAIAPAAPPPGPPAALPGAARGLGGTSRAPVPAAAAARVVYFSSSRGWERAICRRGVPPPRGPGGVSRVYRAPPGMPLPAPRARVGVFLLSRAPTRSRSIWRRQLASRSPRGGVCGLICRRTCLAGRRTVCPPRGLGSPPGLVSPPSPPRALPFRDAAARRCGLFRWRATSPAACAPTPYDPGAAPGGLVYFSTSSQKSLSTCTPTISTSSRSLPYLTYLLIRRLRTFFLAIRHLEIGIEHVKEVVEGEAFLVEDDAFQRHQRIGEVGCADALDAGEVVARSRLR